MVYGLIFALVIAFALLVAFVRLAPDDPARWNIPVSDASPAVAGPCAMQVHLAPKGAKATCLVPGDPATALGRLNAAALAAPRTTALAGTPQQGRMTWVSRSKLMAFPDYITAEAVPTPQGTRLDIYSRQRYGGYDWGVNALRLQAWLATLDHG